jgi:hypothetical protein
LITAVMTAVAATAAAQPAPSADDAQVKRRYQIKLMEGVLREAVRHGAEQLGRQLPNMVLLTGVARARGFVLDGYGVFFDVEIPAMRESAAWTMRMFERDFTLARRMLDQLRRQVQMVNDPQQRAALDQTLKRIETQMSPFGEPAGDARTVSGAALLGEPPAAASQPSSPAPARAVDPNALYTEAVKNAIIDAMLDHGHPMAIQPDEWLTVAARDAEGPLTPFENYEAVTMIWRLRGSDLAAFRAGRLTREEARKRVEVREF